MKFHQSSAALYIPDHAPTRSALERTSHLGIGAHQDDLEFMAFHGIATCYDSDTEWFGGIICTNGSGSARTGTFAHYSNEEMIEIRRREQERAADIGRYSFVAQLDYESRSTKDSADHRLRDDLVALLKATQPDIVYTHNPADKHVTHIGVLTSTLQAIRTLPPTMRPKRLLGCEVWRDLDWLSDEEKVIMDVSGFDSLAAELNACFASQIAGGKRYDLAVEGRRLANATFLDSHTTDAMTKAWFAMDLTPLLLDDSLDLATFTAAHIDRFRESVVKNIIEQSGA